MLDEISEDRLKDFPSETKQTILPPSKQDYKGQLVARGSLQLSRNPDNPEDWKTLEQKAMKVLEDGMDSETYKDRKSAADTVFEIQGKKGGRKTDLPGGVGMIMSEEVAKTLAEGLTHFAKLADADKPVEKDVTNESFKLSTGGNR